MDSGEGANSKEIAGLTGSAEAIKVLSSALQLRQSTANPLTIARIAEQLGFSRRETELADLILRGSSAREIAGQLKIAMPTVKTHIRHILHKAGVSTRLQFVGLCRPQS
jgi:DNA-binding CsgD family transcriptional regulator